MNECKFSGVSGFFRGRQELFIKASQALDCAAPIGQQAHDLVARSITGFVQRFPGTVGRKRSAANFSVEVVADKQRNLDCDAKGIAATLVIDCASRVMVVLDA